MKKLLGFIVALGLAGADARIVRAENTPVDEMPPATSPDSPTAAPAPLPAENPPAENPPAAPASAAPIPVPPQKPYQRHFALGISTLKELGIGAALVRGRYEYIEAEAAFGVQLVLLFIQGGCHEVVFDYSLQFTGSLLIYFEKDQKRFNNGLRVGGIWNDKFGGGGIIGWQAEERLNRYMQLGYGAGLQIFPEGRHWAEKRAASACGVPGRVHIDPIQTIVQPYIGVSLLFYLL